MPIGDSVGGSRIPPALVFATETHTPSLALDDRGAGDPLVLLHGFATTRRVWLGTAALLERSRRVITVDLPGFGGSSPAGPGFELPAVADRLADGLRRAGVCAPYDLVGHSLGGAVAVVLAARHPGCVRRLVLVAPAGFASPAGLGGRPVPIRAARALSVPVAGVQALRRAAAPLSDFSWGRRVLLGLAIADPAAIAPSHARALARASAGATRLRAALTTVLRADLGPALTDSQAPLGVIWAGADRVIGRRAAGAISKLRPEAEQLTIGGAGHVVMAERPAELAQAVEGLLERLL